MLDTIVQTLQSNQLLTAGIGTTLMASALYLLRAIPSWIYHTTKRMLTIELEITSESHLYTELLRTLDAYRIPLFARSYSTDSVKGLTSGYGASIAFYKGRFIEFSRSMLDGKITAIEKLNLTLLSRDTAFLVSLLEEARRPPETDKIQLFMSSGDWWDSCKPKRKRDLSTVFVNAATKATIVDRIEWFLANRAWYTQRGIPYKLAILLHGEPGTGKTSLVYSIASHFNRALATFESLACVTECLRNTPDDAFVVMEDIDMMVASRPAAEEESKDDKPSNKPSRNNKPTLGVLHSLINAIDGLNTPDGLVLFITTNYKDRLDPALVRPGRIDLDLEIGRLDREATELMFTAFYGEEHLPLIRTIEFAPHTGAELQQKFAETDPQLAIHNLISSPEWKETTRSIPRLFVDNLHKR